MRKDGSKSVGPLMCLGGCRLFIIIVIIVMTTHDRSDPSHAFQQFVHTSTK